MEEIVTVNGRQFKLTIDRPLTATERQQVITDIKKQTGCGTCGPRAQPNTLSTGGVYSLPFNDTTPSGVTGVSGKRSTDTVNLSATPDGGVAPYSVKFWKSLDGAVLDQTNITGANQTALTDGLTKTASYVLVDADVAGALGNTGALEPSDVDVGTGAITLTGAPASLDPGSIRFYVSIVDSCTGATGQGTCAQYADVATACVAPTCSFVVS